MADNLSDDLFGEDTEEEFPVITIVDEQDVEHKFELCDSIQTDKGRYVALFPIYDDPSELVDDDGELVILSVVEEDGEDMLVTIDNEDEFNEIAGLFEERLSDLFEIDMIEDEAE